MQSRLVLISVGYQSSIYDGTVCLPTLLTEQDTGSHKATV